RGPPAQLAWRDRGAEEPGAQAGMLNEGNGPGSAARHKAAQGDLQQRQHDHARQGEPRKKVLTGGEASDDRPARMGCFGCCVLEAQASLDQRPPLGGCCFRWLSRSLIAASKMSAGTNPP